MYCLGQEYSFVTIPCCVCIRQQLSQVYIECVAVIPYTGEFIVMCVYSLNKVLVMLMLEIFIVYCMEIALDLQNLCQIARDT